jgi:hypothetical protein
MPVEVLPPPAGGRASAVPQSIPKPRERRKPCEVIERPFLAPKEAYIRRDELLAFLRLPEATFDRMREAGALPAPDVDNGHQCQFWRRDTALGIQLILPFLCRKLAAAEGLPSHPSAAHAA